MASLIILVFILGYLAIACEHFIKINKTASALLTGVLCWVLLVLSDPAANPHLGAEYQQFLTTMREKGGGLFLLDSPQLYSDYILKSLNKSISHIAEILFFLMASMTIVELIDAHHGFRAVTDRIKSRNPRRLLWIVCMATFLLSAVLDNLTATIVMISLVRKLIPNKDTRLFFAGMIVVAANAGGAWSPIGDVTTTMLWIGGQITALHVMKMLILPSIVCALVPLLYLHFTFKGELGTTEPLPERDEQTRAGNLMLWMGVSIFAAVPVFKALTHLPPYMGVMLGLGIIWLTSEFINPDLDEANRRRYTAAHALSRIDMPSVLFFLGILLAVASLETQGTLRSLAQFLAEHIGDNRIIITMIGILSAIVDNVPLVAASMGMYDLNQYPTNHIIWTYLAYCAGTGGSMLIVGSAAGVAAMGMEKIDFGWYLKKITLLALLGYFAGAAVFIILMGLMG